MALGIFGTNATSIKIVACILFVLVSHNVGAILSKDCTMSLILSVLAGLAMAGTFGMKLETYATARIQVKIALNNNSLNI